MAIGRPSLFRAEYVEQVEKLCLLGMTNDDLAIFFGVAPSTVSKWLVGHKTFSEACARGREIADSNVAEKLYRRATGYSHQAVKIAQNASTGDVVQTEYTEHYPPDTQAATWWLKNRRKQSWQDKTETEHSGQVTVVPVINVKSSQA